MVVSVGWVVFSVLDLCIRSIFALA
jgi:hypothetical protein